MSGNEEWSARQDRSEEDRKGYERERLILWTLDSLSELIADSGMSRADIARKLGTSRANLTQIFSGSRNATLGTVADLAWACGKRAVIRFEPLRNGNFISSPVRMVDNRPKIVPMSPETKLVRRAPDAPPEFVNLSASAM
jgi:transcriptional regulator with XRE-family HTH domain